MCGLTGTACCEKQWSYFGGFFYTSIQPQSELEEKHHHHHQHLRYINNSLHLGRKYARIFVRGHYLFREANSFPRAKLEENCELRGTDNVQGQISGHIFEAKWMLLCLLSFKYFFYKAAFWETFSQNFLNTKEILSALKILLVCSKCLVLFILTIYSGYKLNVRT